MGTLAIIISLALLMFFAYRGVSVLILAPIMAAVAILLSGDMIYMMPQYTETFMSALGGYILKFFPIFYWVPYSDNSWSTQVLHPASQTRS